MKPMVTTVPCAFYFVFDYLNKCTTFSEFCSQKESNRSKHFNRKSHGRRMMNYMKNLGNLCLTVCILLYSDNIKADTYRTLKRCKGKLTSRTAELLYFCALAQIIIWLVFLMTWFLIVKLMQPSTVWSKRGRNIV